MVEGVSCNIIIYGGILVSIISVQCHQTGFEQIMYVMNYFQSCQTASFSQT